jgi:hypothetical protein
LLYKFLDVPRIQAKPSENFTPTHVVGKNWPPEQLLPGVVHGLDDGRVGILQLRVLADQGDLNLLKIYSIPFITGVNPTTESCKNLQHSE